MPLMKMLDGHHQVPLFVHRNRVGERGVDDLERDERGQLEVLQPDGERRRLVTNHREGGRGGKDLGQLGARVGLLAASPDVDRERVAVELRGHVSKIWHGVAAYKDLGLCRQPIQRQRQQYRLVDAATGEFERGYVNVSDMVTGQPWTDDIPVYVEWSGTTPQRRAP